MSLNGYDISDNQGNIDNRQVPGDFAIIKATEGVGYTDPDCDANVQQTIAAGKKWGVYHFARPDGNPSGVDEANWFVSQVQGYIGKGIFVLDWEVEPKSNVAWAKAWLDRVYQLTGIRPWIYMSQSVANSHDWSSVLGDYSLWVAAYGANNAQNGYTPSTNISVNGNWNIAAWQYSSRGRLPNYGGFLDLNVFYGDRNTWDKYAGVAPAPTPTPAPTPPAPVITTQDVTVANSIPFEKVSVNDETKDVGYSEITTAGVDGLETIVTTITYSDGNEVNRTNKSDTVVPPVNEVTTIGTKEPTPPAPKPDFFAELITALVNWLKSLFPKK